MDKRFYDTIRAAIRDCSSSRYRIAKETGVEQASLSRFMAGTCGLSDENMTRLLDYLGLEIVVKPKEGK